MADLDRYDLDATFISDCPLCGLQIHDEDDTAKVAQELVHKHCAEEVEQELADMEMDWGPASE